AVFLVHPQRLPTSPTLSPYTTLFRSPTTTPRQKINQVKHYGGEFVEVILTGDTFDDSFHQAMKYVEEHQMAFIHHFDDYRTIVEIGRAHVCTPVTGKARMPSSACNKN